MLVMKNSLLWNIPIYIDLEVILNFFFPQYKIGYIVLVVLVTVTK